MTEPTKQDGIETFELWLILAIKHLTQWSLDFIGAPPNHPLHDIAESIDFRSQQARSIAFLRTTDLVFGRKVLPQPLVAPDAVIHADAGARAPISAEAIEAARATVADASEALASANSRSERLEARYERLAMELVGVAHILDLAAGSGASQPNAERMQEDRQDDPTPEQQRERFGEILAEGPVPATAIKAAIERMEQIIRLMLGHDRAPDWTGTAAFDLRGMIGIIDRLGVERTDLALKLAEAERWTHNPRRRPTVGGVTRLANGLRAGKLEWHEWGEAAGLLEDQAAELIAQDRTIFELSKAKSDALAEYHALEQKGASYTPAQRDHAATVLRKRALGGLVADPAASQWNDGERYGRTVDAIAAALGLKGWQA